jgi:DNA-binding NtrC family response regulator
MAFCAINCRIVAASKPDLTRLIEMGEFMPDLYYRLKFLSLEVPALRERPEDIGLLVEHFCKKYSLVYKKKFSFRARTIRVLESYGWPGNIGELEGCISQLIANATDTIISPSELDSRFDIDDVNIARKSSLLELDAKHEAEKKRLIETALHLAPSKRQAAARLGINESSLRGLVDRMGI